MERHIVDAVKILNTAYQRLTISDAANGGGIRLYHAVKYLSNPDRFLRPKRGPSAVKTGKPRVKSNA